MTIFAALLFAICAPGGAFTFPRGGTLRQQVFVHTLIFAVLYHFTKNIVWNHFAATPQLSWSDRLLSQMSFRQ